MAKAKDNSLMQKPSHKQSVITLAAAVWLMAQALLSARAVFLQGSLLKSGLKQAWSHPDMHKMLIVSLALYAKCLLLQGIWSCQRQLNSVRQRGAQHILKNPWHWEQASDTLDVCQ